MMRVPGGHLLLSRTILPAKMSPLCIIKFLSAHCVNFASIAVKSFEINYPTSLGGTPK